MTFQINSAFDSGNIRVLAIDGDRADLEIVVDHLSDFYQWFHFRVSGAKGRTLTLRILNAAGSAYPDGWPDYQARVSTDRVAWRLAETSYESGVLTIQYRFESDIAWFAYFAPYSMEQHHDLISRIALKPGVEHRELGVTLDGQTMDLLKLGTGEKKVWLYARQHPGESMAEWWAEGALEYLTDESNATAKALREKATFYVVPNMNPDGSRRGHLRTNAAGINLNREWLTPSMEKSPEVFLVRQAMDEAGVDFALDVHGDEAIPANFIAGYDGIPSCTEEFGAKYSEYARQLAAKTPEFQTQMGYPKAAPGTANMTVSTNQVAHRYQAVAMTLEMPFKDHNVNPDPEFAWSPERCKKLAHACLDTLADMIDTI